MRDHFVLLVTTTASLQDATRALATRLAARSNAVLLFLHVVPMAADDGEAMLHAAADLSGFDAHRWLLTLRPDALGVRFRHRLAVGAADDAVAAVVASHSVDLVVVESNPGGPLARALTPELATRLVRRLECPVVLAGPQFRRVARPPQRPRGDATGAQIADLLNALVDARTQALRGWMDHAADAARRVAHSSTVELVVRQSTRSRWPGRAGDLRRLTIELDELARALRATGWSLRTRDESWGTLAIPDPAPPELAAFLARVEGQGASTSLPIADADRLAIFAGARVDHGESALLLLGFDAEDDFLRILGQPGPVASFEAYAFDERGLMLSNSRFPDQLCRAGLLPAGGSQTPLRLRVAEPRQGPMAEWPLTEMVRRAVGGEDGWDTRGYRDYRGTRVVGAWRWLPEYRLGVVAEMDHITAFG